jgi:predicted dehydrogenase
MQIGMVGLGRMGGNMARRLLRGGHEVVAYATDPPAHVRPRESRKTRYPTWPTWPDWLSPSYRSTYEWFLNSACHDVNLMTHFFPGALQVTSARAARDSAVVASMLWRDVPLTLEVARVEAGRWLEGAEFLFERGRIALSIPSPMAAAAVGRVELDDLSAGLVGQAIETETGWCFERQASGFIDALTSDVVPLTSGRAALADMELIESIWRHVGA